MNCAECGYWTTQRKTVYGDGSEIVTYTAPPDKGQCAPLGIDTASDFGCNKFSTGGHVRVTRKDGAPWQNFRMIQCPSCSGNPGGGDCKCAGTGLTRLYDDGFVGDERTRRHPKESETPPTIDPGTIIQPVEKAVMADGGGVL